MERLFSPQIFTLIIDELQDKKEKLNYIGDLSDLGNELGIVVGKQYPNMTDGEIEELIIGIRHGISQIKRLT